jgi:RND family efflux transporter MFP subunit
MARYLSILLVLGAPAAPAQEAAAPVRVTVAQESRLFEEIPLNGSVTARRVSLLSPKVDGLVAELAVDEGDLVSTGEVLLRLDQRLAEIELAGADAALAEAEARLKESIRQRDEAAELREKQHIAATNYENLAAQVRIDEAALGRIRAERARQAELLERHTIRAPFDGAISRKLTEIGQWVDSSDAILELVEIDRLRIDVPVPQRYFDRVKPGTATIVRFDAEPDQLYDGEVSQRIPAGNRSARTFPIRIELDNPDLSKAPGMSARVVLKLRLDERGTALVLPRDAIVQTPNGSTQIWRVKDEDGVLTVDPLPVRTGRTFSGIVEIQSQSLKVGDRIVIRGNEILREGQKVRIIDDE